MWKGDNMEKYAVYTGTKNIYGDMYNAAKSLLVHSDVDKIYFLIEDDSFIFDLPKEIEVINVKNQQYFSQDGPNMNSRFSYMALMRAALPLVFPEYDRILSLDVDTIVEKDISDIWDIPLDDYYFAATPEIHRTDLDILYTNAGVTLFNLKKLRDDGKCYEVIDVLNTEFHQFVDQDVLNILCQGSIYPLPSSYNVNNYTEPTDDKKIIHFAGIKRWNQNQMVQKYKRIPMKSIRP